MGVASSHAPHRNSDQPNDVHSVLQDGFWWSHVGWIVSRQYDQTDLSKVRDLARFPELRFLDRFHVLVPIAYATGLYLPNRRQLGLVLEDFSCRLRCSGTAPLVPISTH